jgi:hypothetical protein
MPPTGPEIEPTDATSADARLPLSFALTSRVLPHEAVEAVPLAVHPTAMTSPPSYSVLRFARADRREDLSLGDHLALIEPLVASMSNRVFVLKAITEPVPPFDEE